MSGEQILYLTTTVLREDSRKKVSAVGVDPDFVTQRRSKRLYERRQCSLVASRSLSFHAMGLEKDAMWSLSVLDPERVTAGWTAQPTATCYLSAAGSSKSADFWPVICLCTPLPRIPGSQRGCWWIEVLKQGDDRRF